MTTYTVEATIGTVTATVEAVNEDEATLAAIQEWDTAALEIFSGGTFTVRATDD